MAARRQDMLGQGRSPSLAEECMTTEDKVDLLVIGSGAAGLSAAITARKLGLDVLVVEKTPVLGGTTAVSGGWAWIPCSPVARRAGVEDSTEQAATYLKHELGEAYSAPHVEAYLKHGPEMVAFLEDATEVRFLASPTFPDYHSEAPGAAMGRSIVAQPYDARLLGKHIKLLRRPLRQTTLFGLNIGSGTELGHFFNATRSVKSAYIVSKRLAAHCRDLLLYRRGTRLANGNALAARLINSAMDAGVRFSVSTQVERLEREGGRVTGAWVSIDGKPARRIRADRGVVLACGGFSNDAALKQELFRHVAAGRPHASPVIASNVGDGLRLGMSAGGVVRNQLPDNAAWMPVSLVPMPGGEAAFPHVIDRAKPGMIAVLRDGKRFVNESHSYHDFGRAYIESGSDGDIFLICDRRALRRYGLGFVKPFPFPVGKHVKSGYLIRGESIADLAGKAGIDAANLAETLARFNAGAPRGIDPEYGKGSTRYNRFQGDGGHAGNPCVAEIRSAPFYAVKLLIGDIGTFAGLATDERARVLDGDGRTIDGLFAAGNDMQSIMGGNYPGAGINIGPALTFGYIAARGAAGA
ncbi:FAD-dependent oxidoreductase [Bordetella bronchiseptica]|uniref:FAD-dependent oxidoreductase n=2 Tax=Bordetella bronchiseptica TaxID=518 RepID=UPI003F4FDB57